MARLTRSDIAMLGGNQTKRCTWSSVPPRARMVHPSLCAWLDGSVDHPVRDGVMIGKAATLPAPDGQTSCRVSPHPCERTAASWPASEPLYPVHTAKTLSRPPRRDLPSTRVHLPGSVPYPLPVQHSRSPSGPGGCRGHSPPSRDLITHTAPWCDPARPGLRRSGVARRDLRGPGTWRSGGEGRYLPGGCGRRGPVVTRKCRQTA